MHIEVLTDRLEPIQRNPGWVLFGKIRADGVPYLVLQGESPFYELKIREAMEDPQGQGRLIAGPEPPVEKWQQIIGWLSGNDFVKGKRRQAAIIMSSWEARPNAPSDPFQCVVNTYEEVNTMTCYTCPLREQCRKRIIELGIDPEYTEDIESAQKHVPGVLE